MSSYSRLADLITKCAPDQDPGNGQVRVVMNRKTKKTGSKLPPLHGIWGEYVTYLVRTRGFVDLGPEEREIREFGSDEALNVRLSVRAECKSEEGAEQAVRALDGPDGVERTFFGLLDHWWEEKIGGREGEFIRDFTRQAKDLGRYLEEQAAAECGLKVRVRIELDRIDDGSISIQHQPFTVQVSDYQTELQCTLSAEMTRREEPGGIPRQRTPADRERLRELPRVMVQRHCRQLILHRFYFEPDAALRQPIRRLLEQELEQEGLVLDRFVLETQSAPYGTESRKLVQESDHELFDRKGKPVQVTSEALMRLKDAGRYEANQRPALEQWFPGTVEGAVKEALFRRHYIDLVLDWEPIEEAIREHLDRMAKGIGYSIQSLHAVPDIPARELLRPFDLEVEEDSFETKQKAAPVKLDIQATCRIPDLGAVKEYLHHHDDPREVMIRDLTREVRRFFLGVEPEDYYIRFETPLAGASGETTKPGVRERLEARCRKAVKPFGAEIKAVNIRQLDTEVSERLKELMRHPSIHLCTPVKPVDMESNEMVTLKIELNVGGVDPTGWHTFQYTSPIVDQIRDGLTYSLSNKLDDLSQDQLKYEDGAVKAELFKKVKDTVMELARQKFGLGVDLISLGREDTEAEKRRKRLAAEVAAAQEREAMGMLEAISDQSETRRGMAQNKLKDAQALLAKAHEQRLVLLEDPAPDPEQMQTIEEMTNQARQLLEEAGVDLAEVPKQMPDIDQGLLHGGDKRNQLKGPDADEDGRTVAEQ